MESERGTRILYVGTYGESPALHILEFSSSESRLKLVRSVEGVTNPSFLALHPGKAFLAAVSEARVDASGGAVLLYAVDGAGELRKTSSRPSMGYDPCHLSFDRSGRYLAVANYGSGSFAVVGLTSAGALHTQATAFVQHSGRGPRTDRQKGPHAHSVSFDPANKFLIVSDLGIDRLMVYAFESESGKVTLRHEIPSVPGSGPRHVAFHPGLPVLYSLDELASTVEVFRFVAGTGELIPLQRLDALPASFRESGAKSTAAEIQIDALGRHLYCSNRGHDSIAMFSIRSDSGHLAEDVPPEHFGSGGKTPRHFTIAPDGRHLLVANHDTDNICIFARDETSGRIVDTGNGIEIHRPVCMVFR